MDTFYASGKLLLTAEYMILDGALALAVPTQKGQKLSVKTEESSQNLIHWTSLCEGKTWLTLCINHQTWQIIDTNLPEKAQFIQKTLQNIQRFIPDSFVFGQNYYFTAELEFPQNFGLGSSSTLMSNLAQWAGVDAFLLNEKSLGGSGYDVAVAQEQHALLYRITADERYIQRVDFLPAFREELIFIHLNQKQDSREGINLYRSKAKSPALIEEFSAMTRGVLEAKNIEEFSELMERHERTLSDFLGIPMIKEKHFPDCPSFIKSLGAWGGDFVMARKFENYQEYFSQKGFDSIFSWEGMVLEP